MKKIILLLVPVLLTATGAIAQKLSDKDVIGTWKLVIDIEEEIKEKAEEADSELEEAITEAVSGIITSVAGNIQIEFDFKANRTAVVTVSAFGESETEQAKWWINSQGNLQIKELDDDDGDDINFSTDDEWQLQGNRLINVSDEQDGSVYLIRVH
jgi:hypothetical protein